MHRISVGAEINYEVLIGSEWRPFVDSIFSAHKKVLIIAPSYIATSAKLLALTQNSDHTLFITPDGEAQKDYSTAQRLWNLLGESEFGRKDAIVGIGGGATTDLAGFVASTWLRGIDWYAIPTTLAGMVDAAVGGKTGINTGSGKNLVGSFYSPKSVCADITWLETLTDRDFSAGLAEVIKTGYIRDLTILDQLETIKSIGEAREQAVELVAKSVAVKATVVSSDFKEGKLREILNFGHTFGHAIEKNCQYALRHGEAVSIGLHFAALLSEATLGFDPNETAHLKRLLEKFHLPTMLDPHEHNWSDLLALMSGDKKSRDGQIRFVGLRAPGEPDWIEAASADLLKATYEKIVL